MASATASMSAVPSERSALASHLAIGGDVVWLLAIFFGIRSGSRGGPLGLLASEIQMVLLSPYPVERFLRSKLAVSLRHSLFVGLVAGGAIGVSLAHLLASRNAWQSTAAGVGFAIVVAISYQASAAIVSGSRARAVYFGSVEAILLAIGGLFVVLDPKQLVDLAPGGLIMMAGFGERIAVVSGTLLFALLFCGVVVGLGIFLVPGVDPELLQRRAKLIGIIRFAATFRDFRTVALMRRSLVGDKIRPRTPLTERFRRLVFERAPDLWRSLVPTLRWGYSKVFRVVLLEGVVFASAKYAVDTSPLLAIPGIIAGWLVGIELTDALSQEVDHPEVVSLSPTERGRVERILVLGPALAGLVLAIPSFILVGILPGGLENTIMALLVAIPILSSGLVGAGISALGKSGAESALSMMAADSVQMVKMVIEFLPILIAGCGFIPVFEARGLAGDPANLYSTLISAGTFSLIVPIAGSAWIRRRIPET